MLRVHISKYIIFVHRGSYYCPHCWVTRDKIQSGATLIVSPSSISFQWIEEIQKHIRQKDVRMLFYKGSKESGYIQPRTLGMLPFESSELKPHNGLAHLIYTIQPPALLFHGQAKDNNKKGETVSGQRGFQTFIYK